MAHQSGTFSDAQLVEVCFSVVHWLGVSSLMCSFEANEGALEDAHMKAAQ